MFGKLKQLQERAAEKQQQSLDKAQVGMNTMFKDKVDKMLIDGESIIQCYGLLLDFVCITNKRIIFVDNSVMSRKKVVSIPLNRIIEVSNDYGYVRNEVEVVTTHKTYELKMGDGLAERFVKDVLNQVFVCA